MSEELFAELEEPFAIEDHQFKPAAMSSDKSRGLGLPYVDPRKYAERLSKVDPGWQDAYQVFHTEQRVSALCSLTVNGVTRTNGGECDPRDENALTNALAQAFKRACAKFGLGRYLYFMPRTWADYDKNKRRFSRKGIKKLRSKLKAGMNRRDKESDNNNDKPNYSPSLAAKCHNRLKEDDFTITYGQAVDRHSRDLVHNYLFFLRDLAGKRGYETDKQFSDLINKLFDVNKLTEAVGGQWLLLETYIKFVSRAKDKEKARISGRRIVDYGVEHQQTFENASASISWDAETGQPVKDAG